MPVVRSSQSAPAIKEAIVLDFGDIGAQAARLRQAAEAKAAEIIRKAEIQAAEMLRGAEEQGVEAGYQDGLERGHADGLEQGRREAFDAAQEELALIQESWLDLSKRWDSELETLLAEARESVLGFALRFAERLVHRVIEVDDEVITDQLAEVLSQILRPLRVSVSVNPADRPTLETALPDLIARFNHLRHVELIDDEQITRGGCVARFGHGQIDATIDKQVARMVEAILPPLHDDGLEAGNAPEQTPDLDPTQAAAPATSTDDRDDKRPADSTES
ncbi:MAG: FliH/SctL family protein [Phycisphaeraceae bacterium]